MPGKPFSPGAFYINILELEHTTMNNGYAGYGVVAGNKIRYAMEKV